MLPCTIQQSRLEHILVHQEGEAANNTHKTKIWNETWNDRQMPVMSMPQNMQQALFEMQQCEMDKNI